MIWLVILILFLAGFAAGAVFGAPYLPILKRDKDALLDLAQLSPGQTIVDLGSGDGRLLLAAARRGYKGIGYEINPLLWLVSLIVCWPVRKNIKIYCRDFWRQSLPEADAIYVFLIDRYMVKLDHKLILELKKPTRLISYVFQIPGKKAVVSTKNTFVYDYSNSAH